MRNPPDEPASHAIVPRAERALANRSSALVQRTLADCKRLAAQREELDRLREMIRHDIDQCERALMRGASAASYLEQVCGGRLPDWRRAAEMGLPEGQWLLGYCSWAGLSMKQDYAQAVDLFRKAAEQGNPLGQYYLGISYRNGEGVDSDYAEAVYWFCKAAEHGYALAQYALGWCYYNGHGVDRDDSIAVQWWREAAEQGSSLAQFHLGVCYCYGYGVNRDREEGVRWWREAAEQGHENAKTKLSRQRMG